MKDRDYIAVLTGVKDITMVHVAPPREEALHLHQCETILDWVGICLQAWAVPLTKFRTLDHEGHEEHAVKEAERRIKLILVCKADLMGPVWTISKLGDLFSIPENKNPIHDLEVWIPQNVVIDPVGLAEKLRRTTSGRFSVRLATQYLAQVVPKGVFDLYQKWIYTFFSNN